MMLTIHTLFNDPNIVNAVIQRVLKTPVLLLIKNRPVEPPQYTYNIIPI